MQSNQQANVIHIPGPAPRHYFPNRPIVNDSNEGPKAPQNGTYTHMPYGYTAVPHEYLTTNSPTTNLTPLREGDDSESFPTVGGDGSFSNPATNFDLYRNTDGINIARTAKYVADSRNQAGARYQKPSLQDPSAFAGQPPAYSQLQSNVSVMIGTQRVQSNVPSFGAGGFQQLQPNAFSLSISGGLRIKPQLGTNTPSNVNPQQPTLAPNQNQGGNRRQMTPLHVAPAEESPAGGSRRSSTQMSSNGPSQPPSHQASTTRFHTPLTGICEFLPLPDTPLPTPAHWPTYRAVEGDGTTVRAFVGQVRFETTAEQVALIIEQVAGVSPAYVAYHRVGCFVAHFHNAADCEAAVYYHRRVYFDSTGVWIARTEEALAAMNEEIAAVTNGPRKAAFRRRRLPRGGMVLERFTDQEAGQPMRLAAHSTHSHPLGSSNSFMSYNNYGEGSMPMSPMSVGGHPGGFDYHNSVDANSVDVEGSYDEGSYYY